ncbi:P-loop containing nucleoside triphosphate hydrolases superfamily protein [Hibiscus syriacus]|uniref:P-loop containing nucleoside triphosphate hydrolases superfamily protein n=1 Tax=Hibiscus syriacus TaxID=106335 RepID=A0A6A2WPY7_HIBSY|nr:P-loop containing nucleoside triphosphate hydrolases superfamily protein [Hibiscus syriacus]
MKEKGMKDEDAGDVLIDQAMLGPGFDQRVGATSDPKPGAYPSYPILIPVVTSNWPGPFPFPPQAATTTFLGKGAKQWRSGDWICAKCNNHNYASRAQCNRRDRWKVGMSGEDHALESWIP